MDIVVEEHLTGREFRRQLLVRYGSEERLRSLAAQRGAHAAKDDLMDLEILAERPGRLDEEFKVTTVTELAPEDISKLTVSRMLLLRAIAASEGPQNVTELADALGRDKKNVSEDLRILEELGLVRAARQGRQKLVEPGGNQIRITLRP